MGESEIRRMLKKAGWKSEQITYAIKKFEGKRTGMWEIPVFKWLENRKVKGEIAKRQGAARQQAAGTSQRNIFKQGVIE